MCICFSCFTCSFARAFPFSQQFSFHTIYYLFVLNARCACLCMCACTSASTNAITNAWSFCMFILLFVCMYVFLCSAVESDFQVQIRLCAKCLFHFEQWLRHMRSHFPPKATKKNLHNMKEKPHTEYHHIKCMCSSGCNRSNQTRQHYLYCTDPVGLLCCCVNLLVRG